MGVFKKKRVSRGRGFQEVREWEVDVIEVELVVSCRRCREDTGE